MNWEFLLYLACPLMMLFCMKGMFMGNKDQKGKKKQSEQDRRPEMPQQDLQTLQIRMADLMEQNEELKKEVQSMKESRSTDVMDLEKGKERVRKMEIS